MKKVCISIVCFLLLMSCVSCASPENIMEQSSETTSSSFAYFDDSLSTTDTTFAQETTDVNSPSNSTVTTSSAKETTTKPKSQTPTTTAAGTIPSTNNSTPAATTGSTVDSEAAAIKEAYQTYLSELNRAVNEKNMSYECRKEITSTSKTYTCSYLKRVTDCDNVWNTDMNSTATINSITSTTQHRTFFDGSRAYWREDSNNVEKTNICYLSTEAQFKMDIYDAGSAKAKFQLEDIASSCTFEYPDNFIEFDFYINPNNVMSSIQNELKDLTGCSNLTLNTIHDYRCSIIIYDKTNFHKLVRSFNAECTINGVKINMNMQTYERYLYSCAIPQKPDWVTETVTARPDWLN